jgi:hypothetical protein
MPMQLDGITLTADDHGVGRAAVERPPLPVGPARAARDADGAASQIVADLGDQDVPARAGRIEATTEADAAASLAAIGRDTIGFAGRPVLWPLLIGAKRKEQP